MAIIRLNLGPRNARADATTSRVDGGTMELYSGTIPSTAAGVPAGGDVLLCTHTLPADAFADAVNGVAAMNPVTTVNAVASGTAGYARFLRSAANGSGVEFILDVTDTAGSGGVKLSNPVLVTGSPVDITSGTWTEPSGE